jgi:transcriptional regulator with XRE-family HTH domain
VRILTSQLAVLPFASSERSLDDMYDVSRPTRQKSWQGRPRRVSVIAEMALRQEKVSERLLELRELNGLSQEQAAQRVGITHRQWQRWEQGESMPYPRNLDLIASRFGLSIADFFDEDTAIAPADRVDQLDRIEALLEENAGKLDLLLGALTGDMPSDVITEGLLALRGTRGEDETIAPDTEAPSDGAAGARRSRSAGKRST